jgi:hypothetical protein
MTQTRQRIVFGTRLSGVQFNFLSGLPGRAIELPKRSDRPNEALRVTGA